MTLTQKYGLLLSRIKRWADLTVSKSELTAVAQRDLNTESFRWGMDAADALSALECRNLLMELGELSNETLN